MAVCRNIFKLSKSLHIETSKGTSGPAGQSGCSSEELVATPEGPFLLAKPHWYAAFMTISRLLIGAGATAGGLADLPPGIRNLIDASEEILVMSPALPSRLEWLASDTDRTREKADERLVELMGQLDDTDTEVKGTVGADDPMLAFEEAVTEFRPDHIMVVLRPGERSGWQESGLVDALVDRFDVPVTSFKLG